jgi:hypothetical protein
LLAPPHLDKYQYHQVKSFLTDFVNQEAPEQAVLKMWKKYEKRENKESMEEDSIELI